MAEEAQVVGVEVVGKTVGEEDFPDMGEVGEGGFEGQALEKLFIFIRA